MDTPSQPEVHCDKLHGPISSCRVSTVNMCVRVREPSGFRRCQIAAVTRERVGNAGWIIIVYYRLDEGVRQARQNVERQKQKQTYKDSSKETWSLYVSLCSQLTLSLFRTRQEGGRRVLHSKTVCLTSCTTSAVSCAPDVCYSTLIISEFNVCICELLSSHHTHWNRKWQNKQQIRNTHTHTHTPEYRNKQS